jgi:solute:Na+ symporter, SSS family
MIASTTIGLGCIAYVIVTTLFGYYITKNISTAKGFILANRSLPIHITATTVFATWFGSESILGIPGAFAEHGIIGVMSDPIGAAACLIFIAVFFGRKFYQMNVLTLADYLRHRYDKKTEIVLGFAISVSYLGWIAAQFLAFGFVINHLFPEYISVDGGKIIGAVVVLAYTYRGGMMSVAINDFIQTFMIIIGLVFTYSVIYFEGMDFTTIFQYAHDKDYLKWEYNEHYPNIWAVVGVLFAMILGSIPQQDTYQRITSAKSENTAIFGTILGACIYLFITIIPMLMVMAALKSGFLPEGDNFELVVIKYIVAKTPVIIQILFFGALMAAILSTISGTTLAASVVFSENVIGALTKYGKDMRSLRISLVLCTFVVLLISLFTDESIHGLVESSGKVTMVMAFCPLVFGLFWKKASAPAALYSSLIAMTSWLCLEALNMSYGESVVHVPALFAFCISLFLMVIITLVYPNKNKH